MVYSIAVRLHLSSMLSTSTLFPYQLTFTGNRDQYFHALGRRDLSQDRQKPQDKGWRKRMKPVTFSNMKEKEEPRMERLRE